MAQFLTTLPCNLVDHRFALLKKTALVVHCYFAVLHLALCVFTAFVVAGNLVPVAVTESCLDV